MGTQEIFMTPANKKFQGNDIAEAISKACEALDASLENLDIEVLHTGSAGIFGLCRKQASIRATIRSDKGEETPSKKKKAPGKEQPEKTKNRKAGPKKPADTEKTEPVEKAATPIAEQTKPAQPQEIPDNLRAYIETLLAKAGFSLTVDISSDNEEIRAHIKGDDLEEVIGPEGRTLDSLQYLIRKIVSKNYSDKLQFTLDAGDYRASRLKELEAKGKKLAEEVKKTGRTKSIASLNPSERRVVHLALEGDSEISSRSVGEGLFKKVLIYKPGKEKKEGPRRRRGGGRRPRKTKKTEQPSS